MVHSWLRSDLYVPRPEPTWVSTFTAFEASSSNYVCHFKYNKYVLFEPFVHLAASFWNPFHSQSPNWLVQRHNTPPSDKSFRLLMFNIGLPDNQNRHIRSLLHLYWHFSCFLCFKWPVLSFAKLVLHVLPFGALVSKCSAPQVMGLTRLRTHRFVCMHGH